MVPKSKPLNANPEAEGVNPTMKKFEFALSCYLWLFTVAQAQLADHSTLRIEDVKR